MEHSVIVVSSYPAKGTTHSAMTVGVASYTKQLIEGVGGVSSNIKIRVLAEVFGSEETYCETNITVERCWKRDSLGEIFRLWFKLFRAQEKVILISYEAFMFGGLVSGTLALVLLSTLRIFGKRMIILLHQVPSDFAFVVGLKKYLMQAGMYVFRFLLNLYDKVVVFEAILKERIGKNAVFIPHFVKKLDVNEVGKARKKLNWDKQDFVTLCFGYVSPYKGIDRLIALWQEGMGRLVIAGGMNPNHTNNKAAKEYFEEVVKLVKRKGIVITGFVPEARIGDYFSACDVVILPYRELMSSSGPMSLAWGYGKPVIISSNMRGYMQSKDFRNGLKNSGLQESNVFFDKNVESLSNVVTQVKNNANAYKTWAKQMQDQRDLRLVSKQLDEILWSKR